MTCRTCNVRGQCDAFKNWGTMMDTELYPVAVFYVSLKCNSEGYMDDWSLGL